MRHRWLAIGALGTFTLLSATAHATIRLGHRTIFGHRNMQRGVARKKTPLSKHPLVALTFDDLPAAGGLTPGDNRVRIARQITQELRARHIRGVYGFVNAVSLPGDKDAQQALRIWLHAGMNIGNHTWSHPALDDVSAEDYEREIALDEPLLAAYAGRRDWHWFRYPYLEEGDTLQKHEAVRGWLQAHRYRIAEPTLNFNDDDWQDPYARCVVKNDAAAIDWLKQSYIQNAAEYLRVGREEEQTAFGREVPNVLLLHETAFTTLMLPELLQVMHQQGFKIAKLSRVERDKIYARDPAAGVKGGGTLPNMYLDSRHLPYPNSTPEPEDKLNSLCQ